MTTEELIRDIVAREGGIADVGDGKGITRFGQTPNWLAEFNLPAPETPAQAATNYLIWLKKTRLYDLTGDSGDLLTDLVVDWAVHSDHRTAIKAMQRELGVDDDGQIGPDTIKAWRAIPDRHMLAARLIAARTEFLGRLVKKAPEKNLQFLNGWMNRMGGFIRRLG
jgi:lysozyme family protein